MTSTAPHGITFRPATADDKDAIVRADARAFGVHYEEDDIADMDLVLELDRFLVATDGTDLVGAAGDYPFTMTVPGGAGVETPGVTWVAVAATHRRRGVLRELMSRQLRGFADAGLPVAILEASEGGIYGRFGYGRASSAYHVAIDRPAATVRPDAPDPGGVRHVDAEEARPALPDIHERWRRATPGALSRSQGWWEYLLLDRPNRRGGGTPMRFLLHRDGYLSYRRSRTDGVDECRVIDFATATDEARIALWRVLLGMDLVSTVHTTHCPPDDPLPYLLTDARKVRTTKVTDALWVRLLDIPAALAARRYAVELDVVLEVRDDFLGRGGRFRLRGGPDGASCGRTDAPARLTTDVATLGSTYLGEHRLAALARAGLVHADSTATLRRADLAFTSERRPLHGTGF